jgi:hypothetical protein
MPVPEIVATVGEFDASLTKEMLPDELPAI